LAIALVMLGGGVYSMIRPLSLLLWYRKSMSHRGVFDTINPKHLLGVRIAALAMLISSIFAFVAWIRSI
jgi:hypothetical protein